MKKEYIKPQIEVIEMKYQGMLAYSGPLGAPEFLGFDGIEDDDDKMSE